MVRLPLPHSPICIGLLLAALGCARSNPAVPPPPHPPMDRTTRVCEALAQTNPLEDRFTGLLPLEQGGLLAILAGSKPGEIDEAMHSLGLAGVNIISCGPSGIVFFVPAVKAREADDLERALRSQLSSLQVKERVVLPPRTSPPQPRPMRN